MMTLMEAIAAYTERFDEGPPIFDMDEGEAIDMIEESLKTGEPITKGAEASIPKGAIL